MKEMLNVRILSDDKAGDDDAPEGWFCPAVYGGCVEHGSQTLLIICVFFKKTRPMLMMPRRMVLSSSLWTLLIICDFFKDDKAGDDDAQEDGFVGHCYQNVVDNLFFYK